jgi:hypothetical protein
MSIQKLRTESSHTPIKPDYMMKISAAVAALRPGMLEEEVKAVFVSNWQPLRPSDEGWLWGFRTNLNCNVRFTIDARIGEITFTPWSPAHPVEGLKAGMPLADVRALLPPLTQLVEPEAEKVGFQHFQVRLAKGWDIRFSVKAGVLQGTVSIADPDARYPDANTVQSEINALYQHLGTPDKNSALADNPNLKLAVLDSLHNAANINLGEPQELAQFVMQRPYDLEEHGYDLLKSAYQFLTQIPLESAQLDAITAIDFDGGNEIYRYAYYHWGGETEHFEVNSLAGITSLRNLETLSLDGCCSVKDLTALAGSSVRKLELSPGKYTNGEALLKLPNLVLIRMFEDGLEEAILIALKARGVSISLYE